MQVSRRDATDALYDSFYCGSRDDIITKHYHSALHICCAQYITIDIDRWISTCVAIISILKQLIISSQYLFGGIVDGHRLVLELVTLLFCTGHDDDVR